MNLSAEQKEQIDRRWTGLWESVSHAQHQALNWLFTMNTGGVAGVLAYAASKATVPAITTALVCFSTGLLCLIGYAACMFYAEAKSHEGYQEDLVEFYAGKIDWAEFQKKDSARPSRHILCEVLAWISAIGGGLGVVFSSYAIL